MSDWRYCDCCQDYINLDAFYTTNFCEGEDARCPHCGNWLREASECECCGEPFIDGLLPDFCDECFEAVDTAIKELKKTVEPSNKIAFENLLYEYARLKGWE